MMVIMGESWSGNTLIFYPDQREWAKRNDTLMRQCTNADLAEAQKVIDERGYQIINVQLSEIQ